MTLALYGKSRKRRGLLGLMAVLAVMLAVTAGTTLNSGTVDAASATLPVSAANCNDSGSTDDDPSPPGDCGNDDDVSELNDIGSPVANTLNLETDDSGLGTGDDDLSVTFDLSGISGVTAVTLKVWASASDAPGQLKAGSTSSGGNDDEYGSAALGTPQSYTNANLLSDVQSAEGGNFTVWLSMNCIPNSNDCGALIDSVALEVEYTPPPDADGDGVADGDDQCPGTPAATDVDPDGCSFQQYVDMLTTGTSNVIPSGICAAGNFSFIVDKSGSINSTELGQMKTGINAFVDAYEVGGTGAYRLTTFNDGSSSHVFGYGAAGPFKTAVTGLSGTDGLTPTAAGIGTGDVDNGANTDPNVMFVVTDGSPNQPPGTTLQRPRSAIDLGDSG